MVVELQCHLGGCRPQVDIAEVVRDLKAPDRGAWDRGLRGEPGRAWARPGNSGGGAENRRVEDMWERGRGY